jgi:hypothetical protein
MKRAMLIAATMCLVSLFAGCKADAPPQILLCIGDGLGGADCRRPDGTKEYRLPSELENAWITTQEDAARLLSWCYGGKMKKAEIAVEQYKMERFAE